MLDCSSSSSWIPEDEGQNGEVDVTAREGRVTSPMSSCSSHFYSEEEDNSDLPSLFSNGIATSESNEGGSSSIFIHLPDFEVGFISERPLLPDTIEDGAATDDGFGQFV